MPSWISTSANNNFSGAGTVVFVAQANATSADRTAVFLIANQNFTLRQTKAPASMTPVIAAVGDAANSGYMIASGAWVSIFGTNLARLTRSWASTDFVGKQLPTLLSGVTVTINGKSAFISYISPTQINALAPDDSYQGIVPVVVSNVDGMSNSFSVVKKLALPAIFSYSGGGVRYAAATHPDGVLVAPAGLFPSSSGRPVERGSTISLYVTGCGQTTPATQVGLVVGTPTPVANLPRVFSGSTDFPLLYAGIVSSGLCQINVTIPTTIQSGNIPISIQIDSQKNISDSYLPIR